MNSKSPQKGQGAQSNVHNRFEKYTFEQEDDLPNQTKTKFLEVFPKTIVNQVKSPDLSMEYSLNPYQGCEHGCSYCFARPTHEYWGYSAGIDFERKIMVKKNAPELLEKFFQKKNYSPKTIFLSGNTDCYQPIERELKITRRLLELCLEYKHPVSVLTKNTLILRDLDIIKELNQMNLIRVALSIPTLNEEIRRKMEPRTSSAQNKLKAIEIFTQNNIPVKVMIAPVIPGLTSDEGFSIAKQISAAGAYDFNHILVRLNDSVEPVFVEWLNLNFPDRAQKVMNLIRSMHGGNLGEKRFHQRYQGEGNIAEMIYQTFRIARQKYFKHESLPPLNTQLFDPKKGNQLSLF